MKILMKKLESFPQLVLNIIIFAVTVCFVLFSFIQYSSAAVAPNRQYGQCGPYYLWYQIGPDSYTYSGDYIDLCEITFDISDVLDDFDFVYFTDSPSLRRASLDRNRDGISDQWYSPPPPPSLPQNQDQNQDQDQFQVQLVPPNELKWKPEHGCIRINLRDCWGTTFNERCGYAMISIQPKPNRRNGSARIPVRVTKKCPPYGADCSETLTIFHDYSNCYTLPSPNFIVHKQVNQIFAYSYNSQFNYTVTVQNVGQVKGNTELIDTITGGTNGGRLVLSSFKTMCPSYARCTILNMTNEKIQISLTGLLVNDTATFEYTLTGNFDEISRDEVSYFTNTATLSSGSSDQVTVGIRGKGEFPSPPRPERPRLGGQSSNY